MRSAHHRSAESKVYGGYDDRHMLTLKIIDQSQQLVAFEICLKSHDKKDLEWKSCINPYRVVEVKSDGGFGPELPLVMSLANLVDRSLTPQERAYTIERQNRIVQYLKARDQIDVGTGLGVVGLTVGAARLGSFLHNSRSLTKGKLGLVLSLILMTEGLVTLRFAHHKSHQVKDIKEDLVKDSTPSILSKDPERWLVLFENLEVLMTVDSQTHVAVSSIEGILSQLGITLHLRRFVSDEYQIVKVCVPQYANDQLSEFVSQCRPII